MSENANEILQGRRSGGRRPSSLDERGWRKPPEGSRSRQIYEMKLAGMATLAVAKQLGITRNNVAVVWWNIRNPLAKAEMRKRYSPYVRKLVHALNISFAEALKIEKKENGRSGNEPGQT